MYEQLTRQKKTLNVDFDATVKVMNRFNEFCLLVHWDDQQAQQLDTHVHYRFTADCSLR